MDMYSILITLVVVGMTALIMLGAKYLRKNFAVSTEEVIQSIDITKVVVTFVTKTLKDNHFESEKIDKVLPIITDTLEYIKVTINKRTEAETLKDALDMIKELAVEYDVEITEPEIFIIQTVLKLANDFYVAHETSK